MYILQFSSIIEGIFIVVIKNDSYFCLQRKYSTPQIQKKMEPLKIIREKRQLLRLTQQKVADSAGISLRTIKLIENESGNPSLSTITKICQVLGLEVVIRRKMNKKKK